jgi:hypothetical protein
MFVLAPNQVVETFPYSIGALRRDNPSTSFPRNPSNEMLATWNVFPVADRAAPSFDPATENCNRVNPTLESGEWVTTWEVTPASSEEIAERLASKSSEVREKRNQLLAACDWTVLADSPLTTAKKTEWKSYRTALREITAADGFPNTISWPVAPS